MVNLSKTSAKESNVYQRFRQYTELFSYRITQCLHISLCIGLLHKFHNAALYTDSLLSELLSFLNRIEKNEVEAITIQ